MFDEKTELVEEYEINPLTMAILPMQYGDKLFSKIYELDGEVIYSPVKPIEVIKHGCKSYCSSYEGRVAGSRELLGSSHKVPITINSTNKMYFFPSASPKNSNCAWLSHEHIKNTQEVEKKKTKVIFDNNQSIILDISKYSFTKQMYRTATLRTKLVQKIEKYDWKIFTGKLNLADLNRKDNDV